MSTATTTCADIGCTTSPNCSKGPSCVLAEDRLVKILKLFVDKLDGLVIAGVGCIFVVCATLMVLGGHGEPGAISLAGMALGFGLGIFGFLRLKAGQASTMKRLDHVEGKVAQAADKAAEAVVVTDQRSNTIIRSQTHVAQQLAQVSHDVNNKTKAVAEAKASGIAEGQAIGASENDRGRHSDHPGEGPRHRSRRSLSPSRWR